MNERRLIGFVPIDHTIRLYLPASLLPHIDLDAVGRTLATWFAGYASYRARVTWEGEEPADMMVIETHGNDAALAQHLAEVQRVADDFAAFYGVAVPVEVDNAWQPIERAPERAYTVEQAAEYLDIEASTVRYHVYQSKRLHPDTTEPVLTFTQAELDQFRATRRRSGRPRATGE